MARKHLQQQEYVGKVEEIEAAKALVEGKLVSTKLELDGLKIELSKEADKEMLYC